MFEFGKIEEYFIASVIDVSDPLESGRIKIKLIGRPELETSDDDLPWSLVLQPTSNTSLNGSGCSPSILEDSIVFGVYLDKSKQHPLILGTIFGLNDISEIPSSLKNSEVFENRISNVETSVNFTEPTSKYSPEYPFNWTTSFSGGNFTEMDNTRGLERISWYHNSGTFEEVHPDGDIVKKIIKDDYEIILGNKFIKVIGNVEIEVSGNVNSIIDGNMTSLVHGNVIENIDGNKEVNILGDYTQSVQGSKIIEVVGEISESSQTKIKNTAPTIELN